MQPVRIFGSYEAFPKGSDKISLAPITVVLGETIHFTDADLNPSLHGDDERALYQSLSDRVMSAIAELQLPAEA